MKTFILTLSAALVLHQANAQATPSEKPNLSTMPGPQPVAAGAPLDTTGWRFATLPRAEAVDKHSGSIRFRITLTDNGEVESVTPVESSVSAAQEKLCRQALLNASFVRISPAAGRTSGLYTFRFIVR